MSSPIRKHSRLLYHDPSIDPLPYLFVRLIMGDSWVSER